MPYVNGEFITPPTVIKQLEPQGVSVFYPITPRRVSIWSDKPGGTVKPEYSHLKDHVFVGTQNREYRRSMRKPLRPNNLRRMTRADKAAWAEAEANG